MSRSRRKTKRAKCICGRHLIPFVENVGRKPWNPGCPHPLMENVKAENGRFLRHRTRKTGSIVESAARSADRVCTCGSITARAICPYCDGVRTSGAL